MSAEEFEETWAGKTAESAFKKAVKQAQYDNGHAGYTGSIAEKDEFTLVVPDPGETPEECVARHKKNGTFDNKWGPAGCVKLKAGEWIFFGWASS